MKRNISISNIFSLSLALAFTAGASFPSFSDTIKGGALAPEIIKQQIIYLASDELQGRGSGTPGNEKAAKFIAEQFARSGLKPLGIKSQRDTAASPDGSGYFQPFMFQAGRAIGKGNKLTATLEGKTHNYKAMQEFEPSGISSGGNAKGEVAFVGFGIRAPQANHDDYKGVDVKGKIVLLLAGSPKDDPHSPLAEFAGIRNKALTARELGATALLVVMPTKSDAPGGQSGDLGNTSDAGLPVVRVKHNVVESWIAASKKTLESLEQQANEGNFVSMPTSVSIALNADVKKVEKVTANVIGMLEGSDPVLKNEYIVLGAHLDHLGMGGPGSLAKSSAPEIHHGADDNASGTAGILALARWFGKGGVERPKRSLIFMAFSGEELGLLGSDHYVKHPIIPLEKTAAMLNMDMIGRLREDKLIVTGSGTAKEWDALLSEVNSKAGFQLAKSEDGFGASDQQSFYSKNVPVLFFFTGNHSDYHTPTDTADKINAEGESKVLALVADCATRIANFISRPTFQQINTPSPGGRNTGFRVYFGSIPDYAFGGEGVQLNGVREGSPAGKAGLMAGDIIIKFGDTTIKNVQDYTVVLGNYRPGDMVDVVVMRGAQKLTLKVTLAARKE